MIIVRSYFSRSPNASKLFYFLVTCLIALSPRCVFFLKVKKSYGPRADWDLTKISLAVFFFTIPRKNI